MFKFNKIKLNKLPKSPLFFILFIDFLSLILAVIWAVVLGQYPTHYMEEGQPITWLSVAQLCAISTFCFLIFSIRIKQISSDLKNYTYIWIWLSLGFLFLAADEMLGIHEKLDWLIHKSLNLEFTNFSDRLDDLILLIYGFIFLTVVRKNRKELNYYHSVINLFKLGVWFIVLMIILDAITNKSDIIANESINEWVGAFEDGLKIIAQGILLSVTCYCFTRAQSFSSNGFKSNRLNGERITNRVKSNDKSHE